MRTLNQIIAVTLLNLRNLPQRIGSSLVAIIGVAAVVLVFAAVLSMAKGFERTMVLAGAEDTAVILRSGSTSEMSSGLSNDQCTPGGQCARGAERRRYGGGVRGVVRDRRREEEVERQRRKRPLPRRSTERFRRARDTSIVEGRMFETGKNEILVGRKAQREFAGLDVGSTIKFGQTEWAIVGVFEAGGGISESELWTDVRVLQGAYRRGNSFQTVRVKLESPESLEVLEANLKEDPRIDPDVYSEREFYSDQAEGLTQFIKMIGYPLTILMSIGAVFGALNSMYSSVSVRGKEIATLRALGFGPFSVLVSTIVESTLLALVGGLIGGAIAFLVFNGYQVSTLNNTSFSQVVFDFAVTPDLLVEGIKVALIIGVIGGFFPAIRAARMPVAQALREL